MGVDTKGVVVTKVKDVMLVTYLAERALSKLLRQAREEQFPGVRGWPQQVRDQFTSVHIDLMPDCAMASLNFKFFGEDRSIKLFFECDCDHVDLGSNSISLSMGCWGQSELYAKAILSAWSLLGAVYIDVNDSDAVDMTPLETEGLTLLHAVALGYVTPYKAEDIVEKFEAGRLEVEQSFSDFVGVSQERWHKLTLASDHNERWDAITAAARKLYGSEEPAALRLSAPEALAA